MCGSYRKSYGAALQYFTGSKMHNVTLRQRALKRGYTLSEYGFRALTTDRWSRARRRRRYTRALGMDWIPPEMRENNGEIEAAEAQRCRS